MQTLVTFMPPPPMVTSLAFYPKDNNTFLIGLDDSSIRVYNIHKHDEVYIFLHSIKTFIIITCFKG